MAVIRRDSGCKVGWVYYDNEAEALASVESVVQQAVEAAARGYDFGYQVPGNVEKVTLDGKAAWKVTTS